MIKRSKGDELEFLEKVKRLAVIAMFSDDSLMETLVLKGGNAMNIVYGMQARASIDVDFSMGEQFDSHDLDTVKRKIEEALAAVFREEGYAVFDVTFEEKPKLIAKSIEMCWGGYRIGFKVIDQGAYTKFGTAIDTLRRNARVIREDKKKTFRIDISKFEYCEEKAEEELDGYTIFVYPPKMIVFEKIRAICQQMPEYRKIISTMTQSPRARDFFDIYLLLETFPFPLNTDENVTILRKIFDIKRVPYKLLNEIENQREYHRLGFDSLKDTIRAGHDLKDFDFYFDYAVASFRDVRL